MSARSRPSRPDAPDGPIPTCGRPCSARSTVGRRSSSTSRTPGSLLPGPRGRRRRDGAYTAIARRPTLVRRDPEALAVAEAARPGISGARDRQYPPRDDGALPDDGRTRRIATSVSTPASSTYGDSLDPQARPTASMTAGPLSLFYAARSWGEGGGQGPPTDPVRAEFHGCVAARPTTPLLLGRALGLGQRRAHPRRNGSASLGTGQRGARRPSSPASPGRRVPTDRGRFSALGSEGRPGRGRARAASRQSDDSERPFAVRADAGPDGAARRSPPRPEGRLKTSSRPHGCRTTRQSTPAPT